MSQTLNVRPSLIYCQEKENLADRSSPASWTYLPTLQAPVEKNNVWPINGHPIDLSVWFLASAHGQKWIRPGPHDADTGSSKSALLVIYVQLSKPESRGPYLNLHTHLYENKPATAVVMWGDNAA